MLQKNTELKNKLRNSLLKSRKSVLFLTYQKQEACLHKKPMDDAEVHLKYKKMIT